MPKSDRFIQIEHLLLHHPEGLTRTEISRRLGVHKSTIGRDIVQMTKLFPIIEDEKNILTMDKRGYLTDVSLSMFEMEALHLSARLFCKVMKFPFPHASGALRKLAEAQGRVSKSLSDRIKDTAEEIEVSAESVSSLFNKYRKIIEQLGIAISEERPVTIHHFSQRQGKEQEFTVLPVTLEPHHEGKAVHLVAWEHKETPQKFRNFKIERISAITLHGPAPKFFAAIPLENLKKRFESAWSIWTSDNPPQKVVLRFSSVVASRVKETQWHRSQKLQDESQGSVLWSGRIAEPLEMYPWIRGWGPDVEVLEPAWLKNKHREDFRKGLLMYNQEKEATDST